MDDCQNPIARQPRQVPSVAIVTVATLLFGGCGTRQSISLKDLASVPAGEEMVEVSVGQFRIPVVGRQEYLAAPQDEPTRNRYVVAFELILALHPSQENYVKHRLSQHEGAFRDEIYGVFRNASLDELGEPTLSTLKGRVVEIVNTYVGANRVKSVVLSEARWEPK